MGFLRQSGVAGRVVELIVASHGVMPDRVRYDTALTDELGLDQLDRVELALELEREFGVMLDGEAGWETPGDVAWAVLIARAA